MATLMELLPIWVSVFFTLAIYSFLYGENPWYRLAEHIYAGVSVGYAVAFNLDYLRDQWVNRWSLDGGLMVVYVICILIGLLWYARFVKQYFHFYRWTLAIIVGTGIGMAENRDIHTVPEPDHCTGEDTPIRCR
jgi:NhaP-type Na+/H+ and K+/H+ antiporter